MVFEAPECCANHTCFFVDRRLERQTEDAAKRPRSSRWLSLRAFEALAAARRGQGSHCETPIVFKTRPTFSAMMIEEGSGLLYASS